MSVPPPEIHAHLFQRSGTRTITLSALFRTTHLVLDQAVLAVRIKSNLYYTGRIEAVVATKSRWKRNINWFKLSRCSRRRQRALAPNIKDAGKLEIQWSCARIMSRYSLLNCSSGASQLKLQELLPLLWTRCVSLLATIAINYGITWIARLSLGCFVDPSASRWIPGHGNIAASNYDGVALRSVNSSRQLRRATTVSPSLIREFLVRIYAGSLSGSLAQGESISEIRGPD
ncbi:hypothetical protein C8R44DRAFT_848674 [Mycena epipterygia]|nr:hypothetical protein C8R44DRAFT_848674 [Mycena epipterygia]